MRAVPALLLIAALLFGASQTVAQDQDQDPPGVKGARHVVLPYVGYQMINGEQVGYNYSDLYYDFDTETVATKDLSERNEVDESIPELGLTYRFVVTNLISAELALSTLENKDVHEYPVSYDASYYTQRSKVSVSKGNTTKLTGGAIVNVPCPIQWLAPAVRVNFGYAWRDVKATSPRPNETVGSIDASDFYVLQGGVDLSIWSDKNMLIEGSMFYTLFMPTDSDLDSFGGIGWGMRVFPVWSNVRN